MAVAGLCCCTHASSSWGHCQSESSFAYSHNLWTFHPKHHAAQTMTDGDEAGAQGYSFCDQFPADSKTVFTSIFFSLMEGLPGKGRFLKLWLWRKKKLGKFLHKTNFYKVLLKYNWLKLYNMILFTCIPIKLLKNISIVYSFPFIFFFSHTA